MFFLAVFAMGLCGIANTLTQWNTVLCSTR